LKAQKGIEKPSRLDREKKEGPRHAGSGVSSDGKKDVTKEGSNFVTTLKSAERKKPERGTCVKRILSFFCLYTKLKGARKRRPKKEN